VYRCTCHPTDGSADNTDRARDYRVAMNELPESMTAGMAPAGAGGMAPVGGVLGRAGRDNQPTVKNPSP
jgi:hypothetical protein